VSERRSGEPSPIALWLGIVRTRPELDRFGRRILGHLGLSLTDFVILESVMHVGPLTPSRLGDRVGLTRGSITAAVDRLAARGLVTRESNTADARSSLVKLTPAGTSVIEAAWETYSAEVERFLDSTITPEEREVLFKLLGRVRRAARKERRRIETG